MRGAGRRLSPFPPCFSIQRILSVAVLQPGVSAVRCVPWRLLLGLLVAALAVAPASAQRRVRSGGSGFVMPPPSIGPLLGYDFDASHWFLGGVLNIPVGRRFTLRPSMEFYTGTSGTPYRLNVDLKYHPPTAFGLFYFGGGLAIRHAAGNNDAAVQIAAAAVNAAIVNASIRTGSPAFAARR